MQELPYISIIIPTYKRPRQLACCLRALKKIDYPKERWEILITDDGGGGLDEVVAPYTSILNGKLLKASHGGTAAARNFAVAQARGEYLAFTDDDCAPHRNWLRVYAQAFLEAEKQGEGPVILGGRTFNILHRNPYSTASQMLVDYLYLYYEKVGRDIFFTGNNFAMPTALFRQVDGFDGSFPPAAEDREFSHRCRDAGAILKLVPEARINHFHKMTVRQYRRQHFGYGCGAFHFHRRRQLDKRDRGEEIARRPFGLPRFEPFSFYSGVVIFPWQQRRVRGLSAGRAARLSVLMALSQVCNAAGYFRERYHLRRDAQ